MELFNEKHTTKKIWFITYGVFVGLIFSAIILIFLSPNKDYPIKLIPTPTKTPIFVEVDGEVNYPGLYELSSTDRVNDAINLAGGFTENAQSSSLNLAMPIYDGLQIYVSRKPDNNDIYQQINNDEILTFININISDLKTLCQLPSIGESKAQAIIDFRNENGFFRSIEEIMNVPGIGEGIFEDISGLITIY